MTGLAVQQGVNGWTIGAVTLGACLVSAAIGLLCLIFAKKKTGALLWFLLAAVMLVITGYVGKH